MFAYVIPFGPRSRHPLQFVKSCGGGYNSAVGATPRAGAPSLDHYSSTIASLTLLPFHLRLIRHVIAFIAMIVFVLPTTSAPDQLFAAVAGQSGWGVEGVLHGHVHEHDDPTLTASQAGNPDAKHSHGHNQADHSHDATGLVASSSAPLTYRQRSWQTRRVGLPLSHTPFLLDRPPRPVVAL